jgi:uncharacterized phage protein (TIGR02218 family)
MSAFLRDASPALKAALASGMVRYCANLITISLIDGETVYRWTDFDQALRYAGTRFAAVGQYLTRPTWNVKNTMEVPELSLKVFSPGGGAGGGIDMQAQIHDGLLDGASFLLQRAMMGNDVNPDTFGLVPLFAGKVSGIDLDGVGATIGVKGKNNDLDQYVPRNLYQTPCNHAFCNSGCGLSRATFTSTFAVGAGATSTFIPWASAPASPTSYQNGTFTMTSGDGAGSRRTIAVASASGLTLAYPLPFTPAAGASFTGFKGCDKTRDSGSNQSCSAYSNLAHFRGFPDVPPPATSY